MKFSKEFLPGAATAAHQVEGNNIHSDCWAQEQMEHSSYVQPSLDAVDHYHRYEEDIRLMAAAGLSAYRFSIEWARIEPQEGQFVEAEVEHYRDVIACCKQSRIEPVVTLHHFSSLAWLISKGGWEADTTPADFARYTRYVLERLCPELHYICTINEANIGIQVAAIAQQYMKQMMASNVQLGIDLEKLMAGQALAGAENKAVFGTEQPQCFTTPHTAHGDGIIMEAHKAARAVIRELCPSTKVGLTLSLYDIQAQPGGEEPAAKKWVDEFAHYLPAIADDDFLGVQNYTRCRIGPEGGLPAPKDAELTQMDYEFYPDGLENVLRRVAKEFKGELRSWKTALPQGTTPGASSTSESPLMAWPGAWPTACRSRAIFTGACWTTSSGRKATA